jgi:uncharacterized membrane protein
MSSPLRTPLRRGGLLALAAAVVVSALALTSPSPAQAEPPETARGRHHEPAPGDSCGNLLLRRGRFTPLGTPRDASLDPRATTYTNINNHGQVVGGYYEAGATRDAQGFYPLEAHHSVVRDKRGRHTRYTRIDVPDALITLAYDLNDRTQVVGQYLDRGAVPDAQGRLPAGTVHGFMWHRGEVTTVDVPGAALTQPLGINNHGVIVGAYIEDVPSSDPYAYYETGRLRGFMMHRGKVTPIDFPGGLGTKVSSINDHGQMVGYYDTEDARRGFTLRSGRFTKIDPPGSLTTLPSGIDNRGQIVGGYLDPNGVNGRGFLWKNGRYTTIVAPGERTDTIAFDINDRGDIVIPADGNLYRQPEIACGRPTIRTSPGEAPDPGPETMSDPQTPASTAVSTS